MDLMSLMAAGTGRKSVLGTNISAQSSSSVPNSLVSNGTRASSGDSFQNFLESRVAKVHAGQDSEKTTAHKEKNSKAEVDKIIGELNIPDESKAELRKELESLETKEDAELFLENLEEVLVQNGVSVEETLIMFTQAFVAENAAKAVVPTSFDTAFVGALQSKGYMTNDPVQLNEHELKVVKEAFDKILTPQDASIGKREMKIAEIIKPATLTNALSANNGAVKTAEAEGTVETAQHQQVKTEVGNVQSETAKQVVEAELTVEQTNIKPTAETSFRDGVANAIKSGEDALEFQEQPDLEIVEARDIKKVAELIQFIKTGNQKKLTIQLMPKELGRLSIELVDTSGKLTAKITMESDQTKSLLVNNAESIRLQLESKGIVLEKMEFLFAEKDPDRGQERLFKKQGSGSSGSSLASDNENSEDTAETARGLYA
jgi:flagellar hook-length control protein FliK